MNKRASINTLRDVIDRQTNDSEGSIFRRFYIPKVLYSKGSIFQRFYIPKVLYSKGSIFQRFYIPKVLYSKGSIFRRFYIPKVLYSEGSIFQRFYIPKVLYCKGSIHEILGFVAYLSSDMVVDAMEGSGCGFWVVKRFTWLLRHHTVSVSNFQSIAVSTDDGIVNF